jgi:predicted DNA-binding protein (MmcQ/YjbR family)
MTGQAVLSWCRTRPGAAEEFPFGPDARVFKVGGKMFAVCPPGPEPDTVTLKCHPAFAEQLRREHTSITAAYHMNKKHWNSVRLDGSVPGHLVEDLLGHSYTLVVDSLPRAVRQSLRENMASPQGA